MSNMQILAPCSANLDELQTLPANKPFDENVLAFLQALSQLLLKNKHYAVYPELVALGFWLRASNIKNMQPNKQQGINKALGLVVHFTPANVDTMFVYSWVISLLCGNNNIVRVSSSDSAIKQAILNGLNVLFNNEQFKQLGQANVFVTYPTTSNYSAELSMMADARVMWGGDQTVNQIRSYPCKPRSRDISFADRYSACLINGDELVNDEAIEQLATLLWRDTKPYAQQACSSPRVIYWLGNTSRQRALFEAVNTLAQQAPKDITQANNHLVVQQLIQSTGQAQQTILNKDLCVLAVNNIRASMLDWHLGSGLFLVKHIQNVDSLALSIDEKLQTLSYWQIDKPALLRLIENPSIKGVDRVVPVGQALDFSPQWDGYELMSQFSRKVDVL